MTVPLGADAAGATQIGPYDFKEYRARWGEDPGNPAYVIVTRSDLVGDDYTLTLTYSWNIQSSTVTVTAPNGSRAGTGFYIPIPIGADSSLRLTALTVAPKLPGAGKDAWDIIALLGSTAKLTWILSTGKDELAATRRDVRNMRFVDRAFAAGLDSLGADMRVPRFPPRPYSLDDKTIGLWHLDELPNSGPVTQVIDRSPSGHNGAVNGAVAGARAKFSTGFYFPPIGAAIVVSASPDFNIGPTAEATIEAFVAPVAPTDTIPRAVVVRRSAETATGSSTTPGWSLCVVNARGFNANVMFAVCDGAREIRTFADVGIADGAFHHIAGVIDRGRSRARLYVDGVQRAALPIDGVGAIAPPDNLRFGSTAASANQFVGVIDEVRLSNVARVGFFPVLGEDDDAYRSRLKIFRRWKLPTFANLQSMINEAAPFPSDDAPYVLLDKNQPTQVALRPVRIVPPTLPNGTAIAVDGSIAHDETVAGTPSDDAGFDPALDLIAYQNASVDASSDPGGGRMQVGAGRMLDALVARLAANPGKLILEHSYDVAGPTPLHSVGRALRLSHTTVKADTLGALAHRAGFTYAQNLSSDIAVAVSPGERLAIRSSPAAGARVDVGRAFDLTIDPPVPPAGVFSWTIVTPGPAAAHFEPHSADPPALQTVTTNAATPAGNATLHFASVPNSVLTGMGVVDLTAGAAIPTGALVVSTTATTVVISKNVAGAGVGASDNIQFVYRGNTPVAIRPRVRLVADAPGDLSVRVEYARGGRTRTGTLTFRIDPVTLADQQAFDATYDVNPDQASIVGPPDADFDPSYLVTHAADASIDFGADPNDAKMQVATRDALDALVVLLASRGVTGRLKVTQAYVPAGTGVESVGRRLVLGHETLDPGVLGALAARFFDYVSRAGTAITAFVRQNSLVAIGDAATTAPLPAEIILGSPLSLAPVPATLQPGSYNWSTRAIGNGAGSFDRPLNAQVTFKPSANGELVLAQIYVAADATRPPPYSFEIALKPALDVPTTIIPKSQYDIIMNVLDAFRPIGVEVHTARIRKYVQEIEQDPTKAFPAYSFPNFRV